MKHIGSISTARCTVPGSSWHKLFHVFFQFKSLDITFMSSVPILFFSFLPIIPWASRTCSFWMSAEATAVPKLCAKMSTGCLFEFSAGFWLVKPRLGVWFLKKWFIFSGNGWIWIMERHRRASPTWPPRPLQFVSPWAPSRNPRGGAPVSLRAT